MDQECVDTADVLSVYHRLQHLNTDIPLPGKGMRNTAVIVGLEA